jgi:hypothetical protein
LHSSPNSELPAESKTHSYNLHSVVLLHIRAGAGSDHQLSGILALSKQFRKNVSGYCPQVADDVCLLISLSSSCVFGLSFKLPQT